jgi:hypothetical protein
MSGFSALLQFGCAALCGALTGVLMLFGGAGRHALAVSAGGLAAIAYALHVAGLDHVLQLALQAFAGTFDPNSIFYGFSTGKGLVGLTFPGSTPPRV